MGTANHGERPRIMADETHIETLSDRVAGSQSGLEVHKSP
jgi:hypothetical protein